jgi:hypothetical protein
MTYYCSLPPGRFVAAQNDCMLHLYILNNLSNIASAEGSSLDAQKYLNDFDQIIAVYQARGGRF